MRLALASLALLVACGARCSALACCSISRGPIATVQRSPPLHASAAASAPDAADPWSDPWSTGGRTASGGRAPAAGRWERICGCDVLLPEEDPLAIVHFVGGAFAGAAPQQAYGPFLEALGSHGIVIAATPCTQLGGLSHWIASQEVSARWLALEPELRKRLYAKGGAEPVRAPPLPIFGLGHSLGAKILLLLSLGESAPSEVRPPPVGDRAANILVGYNNFGADRAVPFLDAIGGADAAIRSGASTAASAVSGGGVREAGAAVGDAVRRLGEGVGGGLGAAFGSADVKKVGSGVGDFLGGGIENVLGAVSDVAEGAAGRAEGGEEGGTADRRARSSSDDGFWASWGGGSETAESPIDFTPSPSETDSLVGVGYSVGRNLLLRFKEDSLDQSLDLAYLLKRRFTHPQHGIGGKVELRQAPPSPPP